MIGRPQLYETLERLPARVAVLAVLSWAYLLS